MAITHFDTRALGAVDTSSWVRLNTKILPFIVHAHVKVSAGASLTYTVEYTTDDLATETASGDGYALPDFADITTSLSKVIVAPVTGVRLNVTGWVSGTATLQVRQSGVRND